MRLLSIVSPATRLIAFGAVSIGLLAGGAPLYSPTQDAASPSSKLSSDDSTFLTNAAEGGQAEVDLANLALKKSQNSDVRAFATRMVKDHSKANAKLKEVAVSKGIKPPKGIGVSNNAELLKLKALSGNTFDKAYVDLMVDDHKKDVAEFEKASQQAKDDDLKKFASETLPTLQEHYQMIQDLQAKMK
jgi:putative membrane protein